MSHRAFDDNPASHSFGVVSEEEEAALRAAAGDVSNGVEELPDEHARSLLLDFSADLLAVTGFDGRVRWANPAHELVLGLDPKGLAGHTYQELLHPDDASSAGEALERVTSAGSVASFEARLRTVDGSYRWFQFSARAHAGLELIYSIGRDVTERRRAEDELALAHDLALAVAGADSAERALELVLRGVCERTGWAIGQAWVLSADGRTLGVQPGLARRHAPASSSFRRVTEALSFVPGIGLPGKAWESARAVWIRDVRSDPGFERGLFAQDVGLAGGVAVPVMAEDEVVAVIEFFVFEQREEDERLVALVSAVAAQLGTLFGRKQAEEALRASEKHFRAVADLGGGRDRVAWTSTATSRTRTRPPSGSSAGRRSDVVGARWSRLLDKAAPQLEDGEPDRRLDDRPRAPTASEIPLEAAFSRWSEGEDPSRPRCCATSPTAAASGGDRAGGRGALPRRLRAGADRHGARQHRAAIAPGASCGSTGRCASIIGYVAEELVGVELGASSIPAEGSDTTRATCRGCWPARFPGYEVEKRLRRADGETMVALVSVSLVRDAAGAPALPDRRRCRT